MNLTCESQCASRVLQDKESAEYQRLTWDALRKSINGLVNKVNTSNIKFILPEFFAEARPRPAPSPLSYQHPGCSPVA